MLNKRKVIRIIANQMKQGSLYLHAVKVSGASPGAVLYWRHKSKRLDNFITALMIRCDNVRVTAMEDAQFKAGINGSTKAQEFFLLNRAKDRWQKEPGVVVNNTNINKVEQNAVPPKRIVFVGKREMIESE